MSFCSSPSRDGNMYETSRSQKHFRAWTQIRKSTLKPLSLPHLPHLPHLFSPRLHHLAISANSARCRSILDVWRRKSTMEIQGWIEAVCGRKASCEMVSDRARTATFICQVKPRLANLYHPMPCISSSYPLPTPCARMLSLKFWGGWFIRYACAWTGTMA